MSDRFLSTKVSWKRVGIALGCVFLAPWVLYAVLSAVLPPYLSWSSARDLATEYPNLSLMPRTLGNNRVADLAGGEVVERFSYRMRLPWKTVVKRHDLENVTFLTFEDGVSMMIRDGSNTPDYFNILKISEGLQGRAVHHELGLSHYDAELAQMSVGTQGIRLFQSPSRNVRLELLLAMKEMDLGDEKSALYFVGNDQVRGFQVGDPTASPRMVKLYLFDKNNRRLELKFHDPKNGAVVTQENINAIVASIQSLQ